MVQKVKLLVNVPFMKKGSKYWINYETAEIFWIDRKGKISDYPLRKELAGYLWLLATDSKYIKVLEIKSENQNNQL